MLGLLLALLALLRAATRDRGDLVAEKSSCASSSRS
jgi:hypothetical protein